MPPSQLVSVRSTPVIEAEARFRPALHFSPQRNWINDPNGLVYFEGEWHLFFQHNPFGTEWGNMSWGHAVSPDLVHWTELPLALPATAAHAIFSGSCVIDWENSAGLGDGRVPPMIALYTAHRHDGGNQSQHLAVSHDRGRTWAPYADNPVLDVGMAHFRDPKIFWHAPTVRWIMAVVKAEATIVSLYSATNLRDWTHLSDFGPAGAIGALWECPDLFPLPIEGETAQRWVLKVDVFELNHRKRSGAMVFIGSFDGTRFVPDTRPDGTALWHLVDEGRDFYAAMSWSDVPQADGRRIWLGWMNSHHYAAATPTKGWRGAMSMPRVLGLRRQGPDIRLVQRPLLPEGIDMRAAMRTIDIGRAAYALHLIDISANTDVSAALRWPDGAQLRFGYRAADRHFYIDRSGLGVLQDAQAYAGTVATPRWALGPRIDLTIVLDACSVELFADAGSAVLTELIFPPIGPATLTVTSEPEATLTLTRL